MGSAKAQSRTAAPRKESRGQEGVLFDIDIEQCPQCGGPLTILAAIEDPPVIAKILTHLGFPARAPPRSPARSFDRLQRA